MKAKWFMIAVIILLILACAPSANAINTAIAQTQAAVPTETLIIPPSTFTATLTKTYTPTTSFTPTIPTTPTTTSTPTLTLSPTLTFTPTITSTGTATLPANANSCIPNNTTRETGLVTGIVDGDTIDVRINDQLYRVRYIGIDTPERNGPFYAEATESNRRLVSGKTVTLVKDVSETDRFDRLLRYVLVGEKFVNHELVEQGYAFAFTYPPDTSCADVFVDAQREAQGAKLGLWKPSSPALIPPAGGSGSNGNSGGSGNGENCHPAYPGVCIAPPPPDLDCKDVPYKRFQVLSPDPHGFDGDNDGIGCES